MQPRLATNFTLALLLVAATAVARADESYTVTGTDTYQLGANAAPTHIDYLGTQLLTMRPDGRGRRFVAEATYKRHDEGGKASVHARFVQEMNADGTFEDRIDDDPDFLTILNQPFAIQLDKTTLGDLHHLHNAVPFEATSPLGGARLHGFLRGATLGEVNGVEATGVRFTANGPMSGALPQRPEALLAGTIRMDGTAYYALHGALLVALDATLTIEGKLRDNQTDVPVRIVYHRVIRTRTSQP
jgi:hypothetical protein